MLYSLSAIALRSLVFVDLESQLLRTLSVHLLDHLRFAGDCVQLQLRVGEAEKRLTGADVLPGLDQHLLHTPTKLRIQHHAVQRNDPAAQRNEIMEGRLHDG